MDHLKYWLIASGALHLLVLLVFFVVSIFKPDLSYDMPIMAQLIQEYEPPPTVEPEDPPTPEPQPSAVPIGPTKPPMRPTKTPTPQPDKPTATKTPSEAKATPTPAPPKPTRTPTPKKDLSQLADLVKDIKEDRQHPPTPRPTLPGNTPKPVSTTVAQTNTGASVFGTNDGTGITTSGWVPSTFKGRIRAELAASLKREAPAVTREYKTDVQFTLLQDGSLKILEMKKSSGSTTVDDACLRAVRNAKFPPLTGNYNGPELTISVTLAIAPQ